MRVGPVDVNIVFNEGEATEFILPGACAEGTSVWWNEALYPTRSLRYQYAPPSSWVPGQMLLGAVEDGADMPINFVIMEPSLAQIEVRKNALEELWALWNNTITLRATTTQETGTLIGGPWDIGPAVPVWGQLDPSKLGLLFLEGIVSFPVNPIGAP